jgi:hypothetical protein
MGAGWRARMNRPGYPRNKMTAPIYLIGRNDWRNLECRQCVKLRSSEHPASSVHQYARLQLRHALRTLAERQKQAASLPQLSKSMEATRESVSAILQSEMSRWGISKARLVRRARSVGVSGVRIEQALAGDPGWLREWTAGALEGWVCMIRTA